MTLSKLSLRGARRQIQDYTIYIVTIVLTVALMYAFNALGSADEFRQLSHMLKQLPYFIIAASVIVILIMGWLVCYIMNFMLKRRSREFGTYLLMGMEKKQVMHLFLSENLVLGCGALVIGIVIGNLLYQAMRSLVLHIFQIKYHFSFFFSIKAILLTVLYLLLMYGVATWRSRRYLKSVQIKDLLYAEHSNEAAKEETRKKRRIYLGVSAVLIVVGVVMLVTMQFFISFLGGILLIIALYMFFINFSVAVPGFFEKHVNFKYRKTNLLVFRTLSSKLITMGATAATISVLIIMTLMSEGVGLMFGNEVQRGESIYTAYDFYVSSANSDLSSYQGYIQGHLGSYKDHKYTTYLAGEDQVQSYLSKHNKSYFYDTDSDVVISQSDYRALRRILGLKPAVLSDNTYVIHYMDALKKNLENYHKDVKINNVILHAGRQYDENMSQYNDGGNGDGFFLVIPDKLVTDLEPSSYSYAVMTKGDFPLKDFRQLVSISEERDKSSLANSTGSQDILYSQNEMREEYRSLYPIIVFPLFYLAIILTMVAVTILTVQLLSDMSGYRRMFELLNKLGQSREDKKKTLNRILRIYYLLPAIPAILISSFFLISFSHVFDYGIYIDALHMMVIIGIGLGIFVFIYLLYVALAYINFKKSVLDQ